MTQLSGRGGRVLVGCKCPVPVPPTKCTCEATELKFDSWKVDIMEDQSTTDFEALESRDWKTVFSPVEFNVGGYFMHPDMLRWLMRVKAYWKRKERKQYRRYQHQKRKQ